MDFEITIRNATLTEAKELFAAIPARTPIKVTRTEVTGPLPNEVQQVQHVPAYAAALWEQEEKDLVRSCSGGREAVDAYFKMFPDSKRNRSAVQKMWSTINAAKPKNKPPKILAEDYGGGPESLAEVNPSVESIPLINEQKDPVETPSAHIVEEKKTGIDMRKRHGQYLGRWRIPFSSITDKEKYKEAYALCKKHNLPYAEAVIKEAAENHEPSPATTKPAEQPPYKNHSPVTMDEISKSELVIGWKVKQIKPDRGRTARGIMLVTARKNGSGLIECLYEGKRQIIDAACLEVVERV